MSQHLDHKEFSSAVKSATSFTLFSVFVMNALNFSLACLLTFAYSLWDGAAILHLPQVMAPASPYRHCVPWHFH